tara:strand:- start:308 stop:508 length:201 start_codon:yes stop_codon:yes gene_type:complete
MLATGPTLAAPFEEGKPHDSLAVLLNVLDRLFEWDGLITGSFGIVISANAVQLLQGLQELVVVLYL